MEVIKIAFKNFKKNLSFYALYLFSIAIIVMIYFAFSSFSLNTIMLEKISGDGRVEMMCRTISIFLKVFVVFYMTYSNKSFLRRRTKELAIYALLGYRKSKMIILCACENLLSCAGAYFVGVFLGSVLHKAIIVGINSLLDLEIDIRTIPFFNIKALNQTASFILLIVVVLMVSNSVFIFRNSLMSLVRYEKKDEKKIKVKPILSIIGLVSLAIGYLLCLDILKGKSSLWIKIGFSPIALLTMVSITFGTVVFISTFFPFVLSKKKKNKRYFYRPKKIVTIPAYIYRIRSNAKTIIMLALLSGITLTTASVMAITMYYPVAAVSRIAPSEIECTINDDVQKTEVENIVKKYGDEYSFLETDIVKVIAEDENLPMEYGIGSSMGDEENEKIVRTPGFECISYSDYINVLSAQEKKTDNIFQLNGNEAVLVKYSADEEFDGPIKYNLVIADSLKEVNVVDTTLENTISFANSVGTLIVSDSLYEEIAQNSNDIKRVISVNGKTVEKNETLYNEVSDYLDHSIYLQGYSHRVHEIFTSNSSTFLLIGFLVVLFFVASGSILYFNNVTSVRDSKQDYEILGKMGYSNIKIKQILKEQTLLFYAIPFLFGLIDCIFATIVYRTALMQNILENNYKIYMPEVIAIIITFIIYYIYYKLTIRSSQKVIV